ncbi:hypothetical protein K435DRAFT_869192 [Dendrothele bispora CBS 962.96]|uniref:Mid2 domain-containing protein n=1 Tax=Dendrothele bispora (strain CBS 962.96) TaxID=1314807 RepID=A0A4S8LAD3_DENBC|nr:hypothetical protein K435DRAFT_869192 [Dendrothele bispora CBS 962.96]
MDHHFIQRDQHKRRIVQKRQFGNGILGPGGDDDEPARATPTSSTTPIVRGPTSTPVSPTSTPANTPTIANPAAPATSATPATTAVRTTSTNPLIPTLSISVPTLSLSTSSSSSTTSSTTSLSRSSSSSSTSTFTVVATPTRNVSTSGGRVVTIMSTTAASSASGLAASASATPSSDSGNTGAIVGGVFGAILGIACLACVIAFVVRRVRNRRREEEHFDAAQFRSSAMVIDDDDYPNEPAMAPAQTYNNVSPSRGYGARPPTMIERHMANTPSIPPTAYGPYGATSQFNQYPEYGMDQQQQSYPSDMTGYPNPFAAADPMMAPSMYHQQQQGYGYENPMQQQPQQRQQYYADMERVGTPGHALSSPPMSAGSPPAPGRTPSPPMYTGSPPALDMAAAAAASHPAALMPGQTSPVQQSGHHAPAATQIDQQKPVPAIPPAAAGFRRPDTVYDPEDAYGGM